jgi:hypothetical protein
LCPPPITIASYETATSFSLLAFALCGLYQVTSSDVM